MDGILAVFDDRPYLWAIVALLLGAVLWAALKKLLKLAFVLALGFAALLGWFAYTGQPAPDALQKIGDGVRTGAERGAERAKRVGDAVRKKAAEAARREAEAAADEAREAAEDALER